MRVYLDNCCYNRPYDDQSQLKISMETQAKLNIQHCLCCAVLAGCEVFFSTDKRLLKYQTDEIRIVNPAVFIIEQEAAE